MLDFQRLLRLRLTIGRLGESDLMGWWSSRQLSAPGAGALRRNFPRTHSLAAARCTFSTAREKCDSVFNGADLITLWRLTDECEDAFDRAWSDVMGQRDDWEPFIQRLRQLTAPVVPGEVIVELGLTMPDEVTGVTRLRKMPNVEAIDLGSHPAVTDDLVTRLAAAFAVSTQGRLLVPFARIAGRG
jgi:hypothetical protein